MKQVLTKDVGPGSYWIADSRMRKVYVDVIINHDVAEWYRPVRQEDTT